MSHSKAESLYFYEYLCQKIGSEAIVKARRLTYISRDFGSSNKFIPLISSGSKGEGLDLTGSDFDLMIICPFYVVYESDKDVVNDWRIVCVMDTEDSPSCFTQLQLYYNVNNLPNFVKQHIQQHRGKHLLSNELYKSQFLKAIQITTPKIKVNIHGPCFSDMNDQVDIALCLKCERWVPQAKPWISRSRSVWPSAELISKITSCGTLFVPIGNKGSVNENLQWRISFSVAEKILIYSFSHTQLLCYALLKILLKEIVNEKEELTDLLCSYFLKTLMFWISEENETSVWRPDNIIPCFMACIKRLLYCVEYSTLLHYFIPENNLFYLRFNNKQRKALVNFLNQSYQNGIKIFPSSQTLHDFKIFQCETTRSMCEITTTIETQKKIILLFFFSNILRLLNTLLHHCKSELSRLIFKLRFSSLYQGIPFALPHVNNPNNKQQYKFYKHDLSQLLVGIQSDAASGWLKLASFFYGHNKYLTSIDIINYTLSKYTDNSCLSKITLKQTDALEQTDTLKPMSLIKKLLSSCVTFHKPGLCSLIPKELKSPDPFDIVIFISSIQFAHFLHFLCCFHLHDFKSSRYCISKLSETVREYSQSREVEGNAIIYNNILLGIAFQMLDETDLARKYFRIAAQNDPNGVTSATFRLHQSN